MERIGRYRIVQPLGHGGMGLVFLAHDPALERDVALKLLQDDSRAGLREEGKALAALSHPNIVTIFEIGQHEGHDFITMEYLRGQTLREVLLAGAPRAQLVGICAKVALALAAAHGAKILHRDIKPENVVVNAAGEVKVVDFGIARRIEPGGDRRSRARSVSDVVEALAPVAPATVQMWGRDTLVNAGTQTAFGTPAYMAPEVLLGDESIEASDVYSLGVVLYECLAGRRPHAASALVEVIAQIVDEDPPPLEDPLWPLVQRMLDRDRAARPRLDEVIAALTADADSNAAASASTSTLTSAAATGASAERALATERGHIASTRRASRAWTIALAAAVAAVGIGGGAWALEHAREAASPVVEAPVQAPVQAPVEASVSVAALAIKIPGYGAEAPSVLAYTDVLARLVGAVRGARLGALVTKPGDAVKTGFTATGTIDVRGAAAHGELRLTESATGRPLATLVEERPAADLPALLDALALDAARAIAPGARLETPDPVRARVFGELGEPLVRAGRFTDARPYYEQAVDVDPGYFDGWFGLAGVLAWTDAPEPRVLAAIDRALALSPPGPKRELVRGVGLFLRGQFGDAVAVLTPLVADAGAAWSADDQRTLRYYLGEASWHDGRLAAAYALFQQTLELDLQFRPATVHAWEYAIAHRDYTNARYFMGLGGVSKAWLDFAQGDYAALEATGEGNFKLWAALAHGDAPAADVTPAGDGIDAHAYRIARATERGDLASARAEWQATLARLRAEPELAERESAGLESIGEVLLAADLRPEARELVRILAARTPATVRGYHRLSILLAPLVHDPALVVRAGATSREARLADASDAELRGDLKAAVQTLRTLVADPTFTWDYPERAALLRLLRARHDAAGAAALCAETLRPAVFRLALLPLRHACGAT